LGSDVKRTNEAYAAFCSLRESAPADARVPYVYAMILVNQHNNRNAVDAMRDAVRLAPGHLDGWKMYIWLSVHTKNYQEAFAAMEDLSRRMPRDPQCRERVAKCREFAGFMGQIYGFLSGPEGGRVDVLKLAVSQQTVESCLTADCRAVFQTLRKSVMDYHLAQNNQIDGLQDQARENEVAYRNQQLANLAQDRGFTWSELQRVEDLRAENRQLMSHERNTIAATRRNSGGRLNRFDDMRARDNLEIGPIFEDDPENPISTEDHPHWVVPEGTGPAVDHLADRRRRFDRTAATDAFHFDRRGLGDRHYRDVNRREEENDRRLDRRERELAQRNLRVASEEKQLLTRPVTGNNSQLFALKQKAKALPTYVEIPVSPADEIQRIVNTCCDIDDVEVAQNAETPTGLL
jgi:hypothetical protein